MEGLLRISAVSVAAYDYLITLPAEWRLYSPNGPLPFSFSLSTVLFILIRYTSIVIITLSNIGFFYYGFSPTACHRYYLISPAWKVIQTMVSQVILGSRTYNISRRSRGIGCFLIVFGIIISGLQWYVNIYGRVSIQNPDNCTSGNDPHHLIAWIHYVLAMIYDLVTLGLATFYLLRSAPGMHKMTGLIKMMLYDGLGYFVVLTCANVLNIVLYRASDQSIQSSGASFGYTVVWIMSQKLLLHIREAATERRRGIVVFSHELSTARDAANVMRLPFGSKEGGELCRDTDLDVQVQIEKAVTVEYESAYEYRRESYRRPKVIWDLRPNK